MAESLADQVARVLQSSRAAHDRAKMARAQKQTETAHDELADACKLRLDAHAADPHHTAPTWATEAPTHEAMMEFYSRQLGV